MLPEIGNALPKLNGVVPRFLQNDHMNHLGVGQCSECNPNDFYSENLKKDVKHFYDNSVRIQWGNRGDTVGYSEGTVGYSEGTVRVQWRYSEGTVGNRGDIVGIQ